MDTIFGRRKGRPRQSSLSGRELGESSVPYDKLGPPPSSPLPVGTVSQGLRGGSYISAPITNPTLTPNGTELNKFAMSRSRAERERAYEDYAQNNRPGSPSTVSDSATLYTDSTSSLPSKAQNPQTSRMRRSEASSTSSGRRSPSMSDFGQYPHSNGSSYPPLPTASSSGTTRPMSTATTRSDNRYSRHAPSLSGSESGSHVSHFYHPHRQTHGTSHDDAQFPRPETDEEIEALFENVKRTRDLTDMPSLSLDQKWHMVYNDWQIRRREERARDDQSRRQTETGQPIAILRETPEWYIQKFLNKTITPKQAGSLLVSLRSKELRCVFVYTI